MAYARSRSYRSRARRPTRTFKRGGVYKPRRRSYTGRKRTYRKKTSMSKRILNASSVKKRDGMLPLSNTLAAQTTYAAGGQTINGGTSIEACFIFSPTMRRLSNQSQQSTAARTATSCYQVGYSEQVEFQIPDNLPWQWRRVCFTFKGLPAYLISPDSTYGGINGGGGTGGTPTNNWTYYSGSDAVSRVINQIPNGAQRVQLYQVMFKGVQAVDWIDPLTAPLDTTRITVKSDRTLTLTSGNDGGVIRKHNKWYPMRKNLVFDDDENGSSMIQSPFSVNSKPGMGDYIIVDIFRPRTGSTNTNSLIFAPQGTMYWHER